VRMVTTMSVELLLHPDYDELLSRWRTARR
jgi:hypothetical protein